MLHSIESNGFQTMIPVKNINCLCLLITLVVGSIFITLEANGAGKVYAIICSDTAVWGGLNTYNHYNYFNIQDATYTSPDGNATRVMDLNYRHAIRDSAGQPVKFTWFMLCGSMYSCSLNSSRLLPLELMLDYHGDEIEYWGDEISFHYHTWEWSDPDGDGVYHWNQAPTFESCQTDFEETVAAMIIERRVFFSTFRSGWNTMDNYWECYLDDFLPYRMESWPPYQRTDTTEPIGNVYDWSRAPMEWVPYHPSPDDYQSPGSMRGWEVRCLHMNALTQDEVNRAFEAAHNGIDQVMNLWSHLPESDFPEQVERTHQKFLNAGFLYPDVEYFYCTGIEAMLRWRGLTDVTPPEINSFMERNDPDRIFYIQISEEIYQPQPFVGVKMVDDSYATFTTQLIETNVWKSSYNIISQDIKGIGVGACDDAGNPAALSYRINHFSQDTLPYIEILSPNSEVNTADTSFTIIGQSRTSYADIQVEIYYDDSQGANGNLIASGLPSNGDFAYQWDTSLVPEGTYFIYGIVNDGRNPPVVDYSEVPVTISHITGDSLPPLSPLNLSADDSQSGRITLSWIAPGLAADGDVAYYYHIYRSLTSPVETSKNSDLRFAVPASQTSWTDEDLPQDARFYYVVTSIDDAGNESPSSNEVSGHPGWVDNVPPLPVSELQIDTSVEREIRLSWSQPGPAEDGDLPVAYKIYRASTSPVDFTDEAWVVAIVGGDTTSWADQSVQLGTTYYYIVRAQDDADNLSPPSNEVSGEAYLRPITFIEVWYQIEGGFTQNSVRRVIYNNHTGHLLLTDVDEDVIHIADASDGVPLGRYLVQPEPGWAWLGPYGITIDENGVIYVNQYAGNDAIYRWADETSTPSIAIAPLHSDTDTRGIYVIGTGPQSRIFAVANDNVCRIYATSDGHSYYLEEDFATSPPSAQHGIWVSPDGDEGYFSKIGSDPAYLQHWYKSAAIWQRDLNFSPTLTSIDSVFKTSRYLFVANYGNSSIQALDPITGYKIGEYFLPGSSEYPSMGLYVDEPRQRIFWSRRGVGYGCVIYNPDEIFTVVSIPWQLYQ